MRSRIGLPLEVAACSRASNLPACHAATRGSLNPVVISTAGYLSPSLTQAYGLIAWSALKPSSVLTVPNSGIFGMPLAVDSKRSASATGTTSTAAPKSSGRSVIERPTKMPPALPPMIDSFAGDVYLLAISHSAHAIASRQVLGLVVLYPALYQSSPYSPPPRTCATASTPPRSNHGSHVGRKKGDCEIP